MSSRYRLLSARIKGFRQHAKVRGWRTKDLIGIIKVRQDVPDVKAAVRWLKRWLAEQRLK